MKKSIVVGVLFLILASIDVDAQDYRSIDGRNNNVQNPEWGSSFSLLKRQAPANYIDGISLPKLDDSFGLPNPREISNKIFDQSESIISDQNLSDYVWAFGQFLDHDISLTVDEINEPLTNIVTPVDDNYFLPGTIIPMSRSKVAIGTGTNIDNPINYQNEITSYIDGSMVYGSDEAAAAWLRSYKDGKLKTSEGNLLPWNTLSGEHNDTNIDEFAPEMDDPLHSLSKYFVAGDKRANENPVLLSVHTLFVREHNRMCDVLKKMHPSWSDEQLYQAARRYNIAFIQNITFNEWLPTIGVYLPAYNAYNPTLKVEILNEFAVAAFRFGHTIINDNLLRMEQDGTNSQRGNISLKEAFFNPYVLILSNGVDPFLKGMSTQPQQNLDGKVIDDVRNFLFSPDGSAGLDLVSININRGRERGLQPYNATREYFGLAPVPNFFELTKDQILADQLTELYGDIKNLDLWVGLVIESHMADAMMGRTMQLILKNQFQLLRDGDRFYFENDKGFTEQELTQIKQTKFKDIIMRNTEMKLMQDEVFKAVPHEDLDAGPSIIPVELDAAVYPSIVQNIINVKLYTETRGEVNIDLLNIHGDMINSTTHNVNIGINTISIPCDESLPRGAYLLYIANESNYTIKKFIKG